MPILKIFSDTKGKARCKSCGAPIEWAEIAASGKKHPFDNEIVAIRTATIDGRRVEEVDTAVSTSHFETCPDAKDWRKPKR